MLQNTKELDGFKLAASDGDIGHVKDFYFDDKIWVVRYLVADTGTWLSGRQVLLSPHSFGSLDRENKSLLINHTRKQIENSPSIETHRPVSRQYEIDYYRYYGWPAYWNGGSIWGLGGYPVVLPPSKDELSAHLDSHHREDKHLRSVKELSGYAIKATDGIVGSVTSLMVDDKSWVVGELVVEAGHWYSGKEILISPSKIERISYEDSEVFVDLTKEDIQRTAEDNVVKAGA